MHILEIPSFFTPYGGEFCLDQAKALKAQGHEVRILSNVQLGVTIGAKGYLSLPFGRYEHQRDGITVCRGGRQNYRKAALDVEALVDLLLRRHEQDYRDDDKQRRDDEQPYVTTIVAYWFFLRIGTERCHALSFFPFCVLRIMHQNRLTVALRHICHRVTRIIRCPLCTL